MIGGAVGGAVGGVVSSTGATLAGHQADWGKAIIGGAVGGAVGMGLNEVLNPLLTAGAAGAASAAATGRNPATGAWMGAATALGIGTLEYGAFSIRLPTYTAGASAPANSLGYVLPDSPGSAVISLLDGGPFSHTVATDASGNLIGATVGGSQAAQYQTNGSLASLEGRQIMWVQGALSSGAAGDALSSNLGVSYSFLGIGGLNCAKFTSQALANSGVSANGLSPNGQFYGALLSH